MEHRDQSWDYEHGWKDEKKAGERLSSGSGRRRTRRREEKEEDAVDDEKVEETE